jgi:hypothetical protein
LFFLGAKEVAGYIRTGLEKVQILHELDGRFDAWRMWDYFLFSLSVSADGYAEGMGSAPRQLRSDDR